MPQIRQADGHAGGTTLMALPAPRTPSPVMFSAVLQEDRWPPGPA